MAIDPFPPHNVDDTFVKKAKTFYPTKIPVLHNQLRHIISSPASNYVYLANLKDVYRLDLTTHERTHIQELPFEPRCTASGHGFFCAGDEHGYFAFIRIPEPPSQSSTTPSFAVDAPLPDITAHRNRPDPTSSSTGPTIFSRQRPLAVRVEQLGSDIMNSISIHKLHKPAPGLEEDIVAVLTNNDKVVRIYSLTREILMTLDEYEQPMNHASISPNGERLSVVGDKEEMFFYRKTESDRGAKYSDPPRDLCYKYEHQLTLALHKPAGASHSAYFTTAWSPNGKFCATASEDGYITVFDVDALDDAEDESDAVITIVPSSRPNTTPGAVRTMTFAPDPWDLLIWAENNGRVCIGDLRRGLISRQVVTLDPKADGVNRVQLSDTTSVYEDFEQQELELELESVRSRLEGLSGSETDPAITYALSFLTSLQERNRRIARGEFPELDSLGSGLNEHERQILEGLRTTRQREEAFNDEALEALRLQSWRRPSPRSITYQSSRDRLSSSNGESADTSRTSLLGDRSRLTQSPRRSSNDASVDPWHTIEAAIDSASTPNTYAAIASRHTGSRGDATTPTVTDPSLSNTNLPSTSTGLALPSLLDRLPELTSDRTGGGGPATRALDDAHRRSDLLTRGFARQLVRARDRDRPARDAASTPSDAAGLARVRELARASVRDSSASGALGRHDASILRRMGVRIGSSEAASLRRVYGFPHDSAEARTMGEGTAGVAVGEGGRRVYVGTEEGLWVLGLDFSSRAGSEALEWA